MSTPVLSLDAEQSCALIQETLAAHREAVDAITSLAARPRRISPAAGSDMAQIQRQSTLVRFMSITESFGTERLLKEMDMLTATLGHAGIRKMWEAAHDKAIMSWAAQMAAYAAWLDVPETSWADVLDLTEARNAVAHGSGQLSQVQRSKKRQALEQKFTRRSITLDGNRIVLTEESIELAAKTCVEFIENLDAALRP